GSWSAPVVLNPTNVSGPTYGFEVGTDFRGTYIVTWNQWDPTANQIFASRMTPGGSWSNPTRLGPPPLHSEGTSGGPELAMSRSGDAIVMLFDWDPTANTMATYGVSFSPGSGWSAPAPLGTNSPLGALPGIDDCGNGTYAWVEAPATIMVA